MVTLQKLSKIALQSVTNSNVKREQLHRRAHLHESNESNFKSIGCSELSHITIVAVTPRTGCDILSVHNRRRGIYIFICDKNGQILPPLSPFLPLYIHKHYR